ncbi:MAG: GNAT family N-acetyltransferase [Bacteroidetes bacterium]|nr:GNAT family N-acetyltransferase [Bacteroidota bacterium]
MNLIPLHGPYTWARLDRQGFQQHFKPLYRLALAGTGAFVLPQHRWRNKNLAESEWYFGVFLEQEPVAFHYGTAVEPHIFRMRNSAVAPAHQGRGIYGALLRVVMAEALAAGFRSLESQHRADHNGILIPKLKAGFTISGMEINPRLGTLVKLVYFSDALPREMLAFRTGSQPLNTRLAGLLPKPKPAKGG